MRRRLTTLVAMAVMAVMMLVVAAPAFAAAALSEAQDQTVTSPSSTVEFLSLGVAVAPM
jgi:hypothetical protein